jgi:hypothetical protein
MSSRLNVALSATVTETPVDVRWLWVLMAVLLANAPAARVPRASPASAAPKVPSGAEGCTVTGPSALRRPPPP